MKRHLYDSFAERWYRGGSIWLYSDPHFNDPEMVYLRSNYIGDEDQIKRINSKVGKNDTIIFLGDVGDLECIKRIRGYKVLIMGNHEAGATNYINIFDEVYEGALMISDKIILSHEPIETLPPFLLNIHGHDHASWYRKDNQHINLCAEHINYTPVNLKHIIANGWLKNIQSIHRIAIDKQVQYKKGIH